MSRRRRKYWLHLIGTILVLILVGYLADKSTITKSGAVRQQTGTQAVSIPSGAESVFVEPNVGVDPVINKINSAKTSVDLVIYQLQDAQIEQALAVAAARGVAVRVLLNNGYYGVPDKSRPNIAAYNYFQANHVPVRWTPGYYALTHQKTLVVDGKSAIIMTFNLTPRYYATGRDFGIIDTAASDVSAIEDAFTSDWNQQKITAPAGADLLWSPGSEAATINLINGAKTSVKVYNEEMADAKIVAALGAAALRGVQTEIVMTDQSAWHANFAKLKANGASIRTFSPHAPLYIHAKMVLVDNSRAFVGSENFSVTSLARNRELGIITTDKTIVATLGQTFDGDYANATVFE